MASEPTQAEIDSARRIRKGSGGKEALGPGRNADRATGEILPGVPTLIEVERTIMLCDARLDDLACDRAMLAEAAAAAQADWEEHRDRIYHVMYADGNWKSEAIGQATAKIATSAGGISGENLYRIYLITKGALDACKAHTEAVQTRLSVQQSLLKHLRQVTGLEK